MKQSEARRDRPHPRARRAPWCLVSWCLTAGLGCSPAVAGAPPKAAEGARLAERAQTCEGCHAEKGDEVVRLPDGTELPIRVDAVAHGAAAHGEGPDLECTDCHQRPAQYPHAPIEALTLRAYREEKSETCVRCHFKRFAHLTDSVHFEALASAPSIDDEGQPRYPPNCIDCHGAHEVGDIEADRRQVDRTCGTCHAEVAETYRASVHGRSMQEGVEDVPLCTDCHGSHGIAWADDGDFHAGSYLVCAKCHGDEERMARYDLSADVIRTYLDDFHGASNRLYTEVGNIPDRPIATCASCHGYHDVQDFDGEADEEAMRVRVGQMCASCHEGVGTSFADAWMAHGDPSPEETPFVWLVLWVYRLAIPGLVLGLLIHIGLHFYRAAWGAPDDDGDRS